MKNFIFITFVSIIITTFLSFASFKVIPEGIPEFIIPKMKNYNYYSLSLAAGKYTSIVVHSDTEIYKSDILKNKKIEIGIFPDLRYISSNSINIYKLFSGIPEKGKTKMFESKFITNTNPVTWEALPFGIYFSLSNNQDTVIYNSNVDHKFINIFKHKDKDEYLVFFDLNFDRKFSDLIILLNYVSPCSGGGRGENQGNTPF
ncbi:MAG: hypothetical protein ACK4GJ_01480 [bacterium]